MKRAFSLVELIVSVLIVSLVSGGVMVYLNRFNSRQKLEKGKEEVVAAINLARSSAKGRQLPLGYTSGCDETNSNELLYVKLYTFLPAEGLTLKAQANECGNPWYYRNPVKNIGATDITIFSPAPSPYSSTILFGAGTGRLIGDTKGTPISEIGTATVIVENEIEEREGYTITINAMGQIEKVEYFKE